MPLINGCKYSCEPCIRGHRATSCAHTDRILIEVRKPGRPLESCGHNLNTCQCGRLAEIFAVGDVLPSPAPSDQYGPELNSNHIITTSPMPTPTSTSSRHPKKRTKSQSRVTKRSKKKLETPPTSPPNRHSPETPGLSISETSTLQNEPQSQDMPPNIMEEQYILPPPGQPGQPYGHPMPYLLPDPQPYTVMQPMSSMQQGGYMNYLPPRQGYGGPPEIQSPYEYSRHSASHSSKIEDVSMGQNPLVQPQQTSQDPSHPSVRSQYILATQDSVWRTVR